eukprot:scaffold11242_cov106-Cylindrotheca_fusiformis.AAC.9
MMVSLSISITVAAIAVLAYYAGSCIPMGRRLWRILPAATKATTEDPTTVSSLRFGLIGASNIAKFAVLWPASKYTNASNNNNNVRIQAVAARDGNKARRYAHKHGIPVVHETYLQLVQDPDIDVVYVGVISELHFAIAKLALEHGKHVLLEKPAVFSTQEARILATLSREVDRIVFEAFHWRYHPAAIRVKELLLSASEDPVSVGELQQVSLTASLFDAKHTWFLPEHGDKARIKLLDRWCYLVDELHYYLGTTADFTTINVDHVTMEPSHMHANLTVRSKDQQLVRISMDACKDKLEFPSWSIFLEGTKGGIQYDNVLFPFVYHRIALKPSGTVEKHYHRLEDNNSIEKTTTYEYQFEEFIRIIKQNDQVAKQTLLDSMIRNSELVEKIVVASGQEPLQSWPYPAAPTIE